VTRLAGRVALVTGASRGIGAAVAAALASEGARVIRVARSLIESTSGLTQDIPCDLTDASQVSRLGLRVIAQYGPPDMVVSNAAYAASKYGLRGLHETLLAEYRGTGVRLTLVSPGPTDTAVWDAVDPDSREGFISRADMLRPADVAEAVLFVATRPPHVLIDWLRLGPVGKTATTAHPLKRVPEHG
jgi:NAD(P)-dependent dehydrogenase (short-subunit alcohol dehydrogenase family)